MCVQSPLGDAKNLRTTTFGAGMLTRNTVGKSSLFVCRCSSCTSQMPLSYGEYGVLQNCKKICVLRSQYWDGYAVSTKQNKKAKQTSFQVNLIFDSKSNRKCHYSQLVVPGSQEHILSSVREWMRVPEWQGCAPVLETEWWDLQFAVFCLRKHSSNTVFFNPQMLFDS